MLAEHIYVTYGVLWHNDLKTLNDEGEPEPSK